jgi:hypothetical protein
MSFAQQEFQGMINDSVMFAQQNAAVKRINQDTKEIARLQELLRSSDIDLARTFAIRAALQESLKKILPDAPLLNDVELRGRIGEAGARALAAVNHWDAPKEAGRTFKLPPEAELSNFLVSKEKYQKLSDLCVERTRLLNERTDMLNARIAAAAKHEGEMAGLRSRLEAMEKQLQAVREHGQQQTLLSLDAGAMAAAKDKQIEDLREQNQQFRSEAIKIWEVSCEREEECEQLKKQTELDQLQIQALKAQIAALQK